MRQNLFILRRSVCAVAVCALLFGAALPVHAQFGGGGGGGGGAAGIVVDAKGVISRSSKDPTGRLTRQRLAAAKAAVQAKDAEAAPLRYVSLKRLEKAVEQRLAQNQPLTNEMKYMAGLTDIQYVFLLPEQGEIILAGPAEPCFFDGEGEARGVISELPAVHLEDVVVALRTFPPNGRGADLIGCSIDPTQQGLARMQQFLANVPRVNPNVGNIVNGIKQAMGLQTVRIDGVSPKTRFATVLVAADYRMKLIGIGLEKHHGLSSYVDFARPSATQNALVRWYFTPNFDKVLVSDDFNAVELKADAVKLVSADEVVQADGSRKGGAPADAASKRFVTGFTAKYAELAKEEPVYAHLRNLIDLSVAAAYIQQHDFYSKADWQMKVFGDENVYPVETYQAPKQVDTVVTAVRKGARLMTPVGGGVSIRPRQALSAGAVEKDDQGELKQLSDKIDVQSLPADKWWWD